MEPVAHPSPAPQPVQALEQAKLPEPAPTPIPPPATQAPAPFSQEPAPTSPFSSPHRDSPPAPTPLPAPPSEPVAPVATSPPGSAKLVRTLWILTCALAALTGLVTGYLLGLRGPRSPATDIPPRTVPPQQAPATPPSPAEAPAPETPPADPDPDPDPDPVTPPVEPPPVTPPPVEPPPATEQSATPPPAVEEPPLKVIPAPEAALKAFLAAPDWKSRALHVLHPEETAPKMEAYHTTVPDGPTAYTSLRADASHGDGEKNAQLLSYLIVTDTLPDGFPVALVDTPDGWKVDWEAFVEFRDDHFGRFAAGQGGESGAFHVLVRNTHYFGAAFPGSDQLTAFRLDPPLPDRNHYAFVPTGSDLHKTLAGVTEWGRPFAPVLQLVRKQHGDRKFHLEIESILAPNWRPVE